MIHTSCMSVTGIGSSRGRTFHPIGFPERESRGELLLCSSTGVPLAALSCSLSPSPGLSLPSDCFRLLFEPHTIGFSPLECLLQLDDGLQLHANCLLWTEQGLMATDCKTCSAGCNRPTVMAFA